MSATKKPSRSSRTGEGGQGRPQAARRGSLDGPVISGRTVELEARQGFMDAPFRLVAGTRALVVSSSPRS